jgi:hypothetical protein
MNEADPSAPAHVRSVAAANLTSGMRRLPIWAYIVIAAVYLGIVQGLGKLLTSGLNVAYAAPTNVNELWRALTGPVFASLVFVYAVVAVSGGIRSSLPVVP